MMVRIGNFFFRYRNALFPVILAVLLIPNTRRALPDAGLAAALGFAVGIAGQVLRAATIGLAYIKRGGRNKQVFASTLVQEGLFAHCRNPLYDGNLLMLLGLGLVANSLLFLVVGMPFFLFAYLAIVAAEENFLRQKFGEEFEAYCQRVGRFLPNFAGFGKTWQSMEFKWRRLIVKEHGSTYAWLVTALALLGKEHWIQTRTLVDPTMYTLLSVFAVATVAYGMVRYLKKVGTLVAD